MKRKDFGKEGEDIAVDFLLSKGYEIIERNWRFGKKEIDIIAIYDKSLVIVEVKTREDKRLERPGDLVSPQKSRYIIDAAEAYIKNNNITLETRFDVILIYPALLDPEIEHIERAFFPTC